MKSDPYYQSKKHKAWRAKVLRRDNYQCQECKRYGTTAIASLNTGRFFIGIEKDEGYYNIAKKRIADNET